MRILGPGDLRGLSAPLLSGVISTAVLLLAARPACAAGPEKVDFARQVRPILAENCFECHGPDPRGRKGKPASRLARGRVRRPRRVLPGRPGPSRGERADRPDRLGRAGRGDAAARVAATTDEGPGRAAEALGGRRGVLERTLVVHPAPAPECSRRVEPRVVPRTRSIAWCWRDSTGLGSSRRPRRTGSRLIRRLSLDLLGLPPAPAEVDQFRSDERPDAYERLVDRLLASPQFGERWARPWLDLVRYADSDGYEDDRYRPDAWRYRDWVIDAINRRHALRPVHHQATGRRPDSRRVARRSDRRRVPPNGDVQPVAVGRDNEEEFRVKTAKDRAEHHGDSLAGPDLRAAPSATRTSMIRSRSAITTGSTPSSITWPIPGSPRRRLERRASPRLRAAGA